MRHVSSLVIQPYVYHHHPSLLQGIGGDAVTATSVASAKDHIIQVHVFHSEHCFILAAEHSVRKKDHSTDVARALKLEPDTVQVSLKVTTSGRRKNTKPWCAVRASNGQIQHSGIRQSTQRVCVSCGEVAGPVASK